MTIRWTRDELSAYEARRQPRPAAAVLPPPQDAPARRTARLVRGVRTRFETGQRAVKGSDRPESVVDREVAALARKGGWLAYHTHDSRGSEDGFPDWLLVSPLVGGAARIVVIESKRERIDGGTHGKTTEKQATWLERLASVPGVECHVYRPQDCDSGEVARAMAPKEGT